MVAYYIPGMLVDVTLISSRALLLVTQEVVFRKVVTRRDAWTAQDDNAIKVFEVRGKGESNYLTSLINVLSIGWRVRIVDCGQLFILIQLIKGKYITHYINVRVCAESFVRENVRNLYRLREVVRYSVIVIDL